MARLCINIDHIATLRNARGGFEPDPIRAAAVCESVGVDGIVVHLREDRRHIKDDDVRRLKESVRSKLDLEMGASEEIIGIALSVKPDLVTLVPEKRQELTTEGGLDVLSQRDRLTDVIRRFHDRGIAVSLFVDPVAEQIETSKAIGADMVELHTGEYAEAVTSADVQRTLDAVRNAAHLGHSLGMGVNAGHGLNYTNVRPILDIAEIEEMSIGHAIMARAVFTGLETSVRDMSLLVRRK